MHFYPFLLLLSLPACAWREEKLPSSPEIPLVFSFFFLDHNTCNWKNNTGRKSTWLAARGPLFCGSPPYLSLLPLTFAEPFFNPLDLLDFNWIRPKINSAIFWTDEISSCVHACVSLALFLYLTGRGGGSPICLVPCSFGKARFSPKLPNVFAVAAWLIFKHALYYYPLSILLSLTFGLDDMGQSESLPLVQEACIVFSLLINARFIDTRMGLRGSSY